MQLHKMHFVESDHRFIHYIKAENIISGIILRNYSVQSADGKLRLHSDVLLRMPDRYYITGTVTVTHLQI